MVYAEGRTPGMTKKYFFLFETTDFIAIEQVSRVNSTPRVRASPFKPPVLGRVLPPVVCPVAPPPAEDVPPGAAGAEVHAEQHRPPSPIRPSMQVPKARVDRSSELFQPEKEAGNSVKGRTYITLSLL